MPVPKGQALDPQATRDKILAAASALFYDQGVNKVGVNEIARAAGVSKLSLYHHFGSKEGLVEAFLLTRSDRVTAWLTSAAEQPDLSPRERILAVFDALDAWFHEQSFRGCALVNTAVESRGNGGAARPIAQRHLERLHALLLDICQQAGSESPHALADQLLVLVEGATTVALAAGRRDAAKDARAAADAILGSGSPARHRLKTPQRNPARHPSVALREEE